jgi:hypothetical protein
MNLGVVMDAFFEGTKPISYAAEREATLKKKTRL